MRQRFFISFILISSFVQAQDEIGLKFDLGASSISSPTVNAENNTSLEKPGKSTNLGMFYRFDFAKRSNITFELAYMKMESKEILNGVVMMDKYGRMVAYGNQQIRKKISYLTLPFTYGMTFNRLSVNTGIQVSTLLSGSADVKSESEFYSYKTEYDLPLNEFDYGLKCGLSWRLGKRMGLDLDYYHGLSNIRNEKEQANSTFWKIRQVTFGLRYAFHKSENQ